MRVCILHGAPLSRGRGAADYGTAVPAAPAPSPLQDNNRFGQEPGRVQRLMGAGLHGELTTAGPVGVRLNALSLFPFFVWRVCTHVSV